MPLNPPAVPDTLPVTLPLTLPVRLPVTLPVTLPVRSFTTGFGNLSLLIEPVRLPASRLVRLAPDTAGSVAGNLLSGTIPEARLDAFREDRFRPLPEKDVAVISVALIVPTTISGVPARKKDVLAKPAVEAVPTTSPTIAPLKVVAVQTPETLN